MIRVLIADDHPVFRYGMRAILAAEPGTVLVGEATSGEEAVELTEGLDPDVILMDLNMPGVNGIEATRRILEKNPRMGILMLTMFEDDDSVFAAMRAGARGYLLKTADRDDVLRAVTAVTHGEAIFAPESPSGSSPTSPTAALAASPRSRSSPTASGRSSG